MNGFILSAEQNNIEQLIKEGNYDAVISLIIEKAPSFLAAIIIIVAGVVFSRLTGQLVVKAMSAKGVDPSIHSFIRTVITLILNFVFILSALSTIGIDVNSFVTALGAAGITAGIGLQSSISQIASGVQILVNHPFKSGDYIDVGTASGKVHEIKIMYTVLITIDNKRVIIPNSYITSNNIVNYNAEDRRRLDLVFSISYDTDFEKAKRVIRQVISENNRILTDPEPLVAIKEHGASSINIACLIWCSSNDYWDVYYYMQESIKTAFDKNGISIPYNQLDVHITKE